MSTFLSDFFILKKSMEQNNLILTSLIVLILIDDNLAVQFIFTPSPNIGVYQSAHYQCSVDHNDVVITWSVNETGSADKKIIQLGIITNGAGSSNSSLTIPGYPQYNNTVVRCNAFGSVDGNSYYNFSESTLKIQDKLSEVRNFTCNAKGHYYINCSWSPPFSLDGVPIYNYIINVTNEGNNTQYTTVGNTTSWIYHPSEFGNYTISVAGNNSAGEGNMTYQAVMLSSVTISTYSVTAKKVNGNWTTIFTIKNGPFLENKLSHLLAHLTPINNDTSPVDGQGSAQFEGDTFIGTVNMGDLPDKKKWLISFSLVYNSGLYINVSQPTVFSTFDVQNGSLEVIDSTIGEVCFTCHFVTGSQSQGCYVEYKCLKTDFNGNITINSTSLGNSIAYECTTGVHRSMYNVTFYDMDYNRESAFQLTHQHVAGLSPTSSTMVFSMTTTNIVISPSPTTTLCPNCDNLGNVQGGSSVFVVAVAVSVLIIIIAAVIVILSTFVILYKAKTRKCKWIMPQKNEQENDTNLSSMKYIEK